MRHEIIVISGRFSFFHALGMEVLRIECRHIFRREKLFKYRELVV